MILPAPPSHLPVMLDEVLETLIPRDGGIYIDATFGRGGYTRALLEAADTKVFAIDRDPDAIKAAESMVEEFNGRLTIVHGAFGDMAQLMAAQGVKAVDGIVFDLGVSSPQLDQADRGFSFQKDGPLDMRMARKGQSAADLVNNLSEGELADIFYGFGEERFARRVARAIVEERRKESFVTTTQLANLVRQHVKRSPDGIDPATRTFQGLRIAVNDEMGELKRGLESTISLLKPEGRLVVVAFHSIEDRVVKEFLRDRCGNSPRQSRHMPIDNTSSEPLFTPLTRKPMLPSEDSILNNNRARSAKLRAALRVPSPSKESAA